MDHMGKMIYRQGHSIEGATSHVPCSLTVKDLKIPGGKMYFNCKYKKIYIYNYGEIQKIIYNSILNFSCLNL